MMVFGWRCDLLRDLETAKPARVSYVPSAWTSDVLTILPGLGGPSDARHDEAEAEAWAWRFGAHLTELSAESFVVRDQAEAEVAVQTLARGDFNGDGFQDIAIALSRSDPPMVTYLVLTRCKSEGLLKIAKTSMKAIATCP